MQPDHLGPFKERLSLQLSVPCPSAMVPARSLLELTKNPVVIRPLSVRGRISSDGS